jgi:cytoskeletal protein CcmA (bactofilin family)
MGSRPFRSGLLGFMLVILLAQSASAFVQRAGENTAFSETIQDDLYIAGRTVIVTGTVDGDVTAAGATVTLNAQVSGAILAAGGTVDIAGRVGRTIRAAGGTVRLDGSAGTDAVLAGGTVTIGRTGLISRDLVIGGGNVLIAGAVGRNVLIGAGRVMLGGTVHGDVEVQADRVVVLPTARISGRLRYAASQPAEVQPGAQVSDGVERVRPVVRPRIREVPAGRPRVGWFWRVVEWGWLLALGLIIFALLPRIPVNVVNEIRTRIGASALTGFLVLVVAPGAAIALAITVLGIPTAAALTLLWLLTLYPSQLFTATWLGERVLNAARKDAVPSTYWALIVGVTILAILYAIPFVGWVFRLIALLLGLGATWLALWRSTRSRPPGLPPAPAGTA